MWAWLSFGRRLRAVERSIRAYRADREALLLEHDELLARLSIVEAKLESNAVVTPKGC